MADFKLGEVFKGRLEGKPATVVIVRTYGQLAEAAVAADRQTIISLHQDSLSDWERVPATERDWYLEGLWSDNHLLWSVLIPGFDAAWAFFTFRISDLRADGGNIRVGSAAKASDGELMAFDDAGAFGPEPLQGESAAVERLRD